MSFLSLRGKAVHCIYCNRYITIEYKGGNKPTQISDFAVTEQIELNKKLMPKDYDFERYGYYYHVGAICKDCIKKQHRILKKHLLVEPDFILLEHIKTLEMIEEKLTSIIYSVTQSYLEKLDIEVLRRVNRKSCEQILNTKTFGLKKERLRLADKFVNESRELFIQDIRSKIKESNEYKYILEAVYAISQGFDKSIMSHLKFKGDIYVKINYEVEENLNPYICTETTVRKPAEINGDIQFFDGPIEIDKEGITEIINNKSKYTLDNPEIEETFHYEVERLLKKIPHKLIGLDFWQ